MTIQQHASFDSSAAELNATSKLVKAWESKNAKNAAKAGGISMMALSLAACGGSSTTTTTATDTTTTTDTTTVAGAKFSLTPLDDIASDSMALNGSLTSTFRFTDGNETITGMTATMASTDVLIDNSSADNDVLNITGTGTTAITSVNIETVNLNAASGTVLLSANTLTGTKVINVSGNVAAEVDNAPAASVINSVGYGRVINVDADKYDGTTADKNPDELNLGVTGGTYGSTASTQTGFSLTNDSSTAGETVIETVNVTSYGSVANVYNLDASTNVTLSTVNLLGAADQTVRVAAGDVTGLTVVGTDATGTVTLRIDTNSTSAAVNATNMSGIDNFLMVDGTVGSDNASIASLYSGATVTLGDDFGGENSVFTVKGATYAAPAASLNIIMDNETAADAVDAQQIDVQNISALNITSSGNASESTSIFNLIDDLVGDASTITITGDTSLNLDANIDAKQTASTDAARAVTVDAQGMTSTAFLDFAAADNAKVSYTVTGTGNADTIVVNQSGSTVTAGAGKDTITGGDGVDAIDAGAGNDHIDVSFGADSITGGAGNDTYDIDSTSASATAQVSETAAYDGGANGAAAAGDNIIVTIDGNVYSVTTAANSDLDSTVDLFLSTHGTTILSAHGITAAGVDKDAANTPVFDALKFTGKSDGTSFTITSSFNDGGTAEANTVATTAGVAAKDVDTDITDFSIGDIVDTAGLGAVGAGGYYEGAASGMTGTTEYGVVVVTDTSYATSEAAEDAVAAATFSAGNAANQTDNGTSDVVIVYLNSTTGKATATFDTDLDTNGTGTTNDIVVFESITTLADLAATMSADSFVI